MDFNQALGAEFREVREIEHDGKPARAVVATRLYTAHTAEVWDALTNAERIPRWFLPITGDLQPGGRYQLEGNAEGTVERCEPPETLEVTWEFAGNVSWVSVRLVPEDDRTRLTLVHTMLQDEASEAHWAQYGPGATGVGWDLSFVGLGLHLASGGEAVDRQASEEWMASESGKDFIRDSARSWGDAHVESGEDAAAARDVAARTASFYTGE